MKLSGDEIGIVHDQCKKEGRGTYRVGAHFKRKFTPLKKKEWFGFDRAADLILKSMKEFPYGD